PYLLYVRSGDSFYLIEGIRQTRKIFDLGYCHYTTEKYENFNPWYPYRKIVGALCDYKGYVPWFSGARVGDYNSMVDFLYWYTYLTGDERGREVAEEWWKSTEKYVHPSGSNRSEAGTLASTIFLYSETQNKKMIPFIHEYFESMCKGQTKYGYFNEWQNYAPWLERYYDLTKSEKAKKILERWANSFLNGWGGISSKWGHYLNIIAKAASVSGEEKFLKYGKGIRIEETLTAPENYIFPDDFYRTSLGHYLIYGLIYWLDVEKRFSTKEFIWPRTTWYPSQLKEGKYIVEIYILDEKDGEFKILLAGQRPGKGHIIGPSGKVINNFDFTDIPPHRPHGSYSMAKWGEIKIPSDGKKGIYKVVCENSKYYRFVIPVTENMPEIYPLPENRIIPYRAAFYLPKNTGKYKIYFTPVVNINLPLCVLYEDGGKNFFKEIPFTVDTSKNNKFMVVGCKYAGKGYYKIEIKGQREINYFSVDIKRLFKMGRK
ncbi:hypothetical protein J7L87_01360, partial [bacterium]|nr:hypothetical protein [bacterium]